MWGQNNTLGNVSPPEFSYLTRASPECSNTAEAQAKDFGTHYMKMIEVLKQEMNKSPNDIHEDANNWRKSTHLLKEANIIK